MVILPQNSESGSRGPGLELFKVLRKNIRHLNVIAEDLGYLTDTVLQMLKKSGFPGMKVLQFAFDKSENSAYLTYKYDHNCVVIQVLMIMRPQRAGTVT